MANKKEIKLTIAKISIWEVIAFLMLLTMLIAIIWKEDFNDIIAVFVAIGTIGTGLALAWFAYESNQQQKQRDTIEKQNNSLSDWRVYKKELNTIICDLNDIVLKVLKYKDIVKKDIFFATVEELQKQQQKMEMTLNEITLQYQSFEVDKNNFINKIPQNQVLLKSLYTDLILSDKKDSYSKESLITLSSYSETHSNSIVFLLNIYVLPDLGIFKILDPDNMNSIITTEIPKVENFNTDLMKFNLSDII